MFKNLLEHPRTTIAGLLLGVITIGGVFMQQGVTGGKMGTGTVISLVVGVATALLGIASKDPS